jgi:hypothetical protein
MSCWACLRCHVLCLCVCIFEGPEDMSRRRHAGQLRPLAYRSLQFFLKKFNLMQKLNFLRLTTLIDFSKNWPSFGLVCADSSRPPKNHMLTVVIIEWLLCGCADT